jgi:hypothetical protein
VVPMGVTAPMPVTTTRLVPSGLVNFKGHILDRITRTQVSRP